MTIRTPTALWEYAHRLFGISEWVPSEVVGAEPYWKYRQTEAGKLSRSLKARKIAIDDVVVALDYAKAHGHDIRNVTWAYQYIHPALRWRKEQLAAAAGKDLQDRLDAALSACLAAGDQDSLEWHDRLTRATLEHREEVLALWASSHQPA